MTSPKTIAILGSTGNQGGSVVTSFLEKSSEWKVRALTRNTSSDKALALKQRGADVVAADLDDRASLDRAFGGAQAIFIVSDFWGLLGAAGQAQTDDAPTVWAGRKEETQLRNALDAAANTTSLERLVLSSLPNPSKWSGGKYTHVYQFEHKARAAEYAAATYPDLWAKTSTFQAGWFLSNYTSNPMVQPTVQDRKAKFIFKLKKDLKLPLFAADEDAGPLVAALFDEPSAGKNLIAYREWLTLSEFVDVWSSTTGFAAEYVELPMDTPYPDTVPPFLVPTLDDNWAFFNECGYEGREDTSVMHPSQLKNPPKLSSVADWIKKQDWSFVNPNTSG